MNKIMNESHQFRCAGSSLCSRGISNVLTLVLISLLLAPISGLQAHAGTIEIGSTNVSPGADFSVPLIIDAGTNALGGYLVFIEYDTNVVQFTRAVGAGAFTDTTAG